MAEAEGLERPEPATPGTALERAQAAIDRLKESGGGQSPVGWFPRLAVASVILLAIGGLGVHTFLETNHPQIDSTTVALLAVLLIAPFVSRLKALELGGAKAEWQESAQIGFDDILEVLEFHQDNVRRLLYDVGLTAASGGQPESDVLPAVNDITPQQSESRKELWPKPLRRVLWFDAFPGTSPNELVTLGKFVQVTTTATPEHGLALIAAGEIDAVVINAMRVDPGATRLPAIGVSRFIEIALQELPVFIYAADPVARIEGALLDGWSDAAVVRSFGELVGGLRLVEGAALEQFSRSVAARHGDLLPLSGDQGVDVLVVLPNGERVGIEVASWLKRPQMAAFTDRVSTLVSGLQTKAFSHGILVARDGLVDKRRHDWAVDNQVEVVIPDGLEAALDRAARTQ